MSQIFIKFTCCSVLHSCSSGLPYYPMNILLTFICLLLKKKYSRSESHFIIILNSNCHKYIVFKIPRDFLSGLWEFFGISLFYNCVINNEQFIMPDKLHYRKFTFNVKNCYTPLPECKVICFLNLFNQTTSHLKSFFN